MRLSTTVFALALTSILCTRAARAEEEPFICGTPDSEAGLAKESALPKVTKVYAGTQKVLVVKVAFEGLANTNTDSAIAKTNAAVNAFYLKMSRNTYQWDFKIHPEVWVAPGPKSQYDSSWDAVRNFASSKIKEAGYVKGTDYIVYVISFPKLPYNWSGISSGPGGSVGINGSYGAGVTGHELGHSVGLPHAYAIEPCPANHSCDSTDVFGTPGDKLEHVEYGNQYDIMGRGGSSGDFNVNYKWRTGWIDADEMKEVTVPGVYRIYASDNNLHKGRLIGIRVPSVDTRYAYWIEYRTANTDARKGAAVMFEGFNGVGSRGVHILDLTPQSRTSSSDARDAVMVPGKSLKDKYGPTTFKVNAIANVFDENGWVDVEIGNPGTPILSMGPGNVLHLLDREAPAYDLTGRRIAVPASWQGAFLPAKGGRMRLALQGH